jgi:hypothetical protein
VIHEFGRGPSLALGMTSQKFANSRDPKSGSKNPARGTRFSNVTLNGDS